MRKSIIVGLLSLVALGRLAWSHEGHHGQAAEGKAVKVDAEHGAGGKPITVKGELVDMSCYMAHEGKGKKHSACAKMCVKDGAALGIVGQEGAVYLLVDDHSSAKAKKPYAQAKELVAETVTITGTAYERGGTKAIVVGGVAKE